MVLLNPGPVMYPSSAAGAARPDICHREAEFMELLHGIQAKLLRPSCRERKRTMPPP